MEMSEEEERYAMHCIHIGELALLPVGIAFGILVFLKALPNAYLVVRLLGGLGCIAATFIYGAALGSVYPSYQRNEFRGGWFPLGLVMFAVPVGIAIAELLSR
jgi:hypothetical protein